MAYILKHVVILVTCFVWQSLTSDIRLTAHNQDIQYHTHDFYINVDQQQRRARVRRDISVSGTVHPACKSAINKKAKDKILKMTFPLQDDRNHDLSLLWLGDKRETQILMTTTSYMHLYVDKNPTKLYESTNGGKTFENIETKVGKNAVSSKGGINKSPLDNKRMILVTYRHTSIMDIFKLLNRNASTSSIIVTMDAGKSFQTHKLPFKLRDREAFRFHAKRKDWILALESMEYIHSIGGSTTKGTVWLTKDFGKTWSKLFPNKMVEDAKWGTDKGKEDHIFLLTRDGGGFLLAGFMMTAKTSLYRSTDKGVTFKKIVESCRSFGVQGEYVFATVMFTENNVEKRVVHISHDSGETFNPIHLPAVDSDQFYAILEMHKGLVFLHLDESGDSGKGTLYLSGPEGRMYTESLKDHFYTNSGYTDFYRVESMDGVYLTQTLTKDKNLKSVITRDRGQTWQPIKVDREKYCKDPKDPKKYLEDCSLHYHNMFTKTQQSVVAAYTQSPISAISAPGIILLHGQAGDALTGILNVWMSKNGGYDWTQIAKGPHHYAIADGGNLIVLVPRYNSSGTTLKYSIDQGRCWHEFEFAANNSALVVQGLVTEPHSDQRAFSLWGYLKSTDPKERVWTVVSVDFKDMFERKCKDVDFDNWSPHASNGKGGCFLGVKKTYKRPKEEAVCYLGNNFNPIVKSEICKCTKDDLQCDYGYDRQNNGDCRRNKNYTLMICKEGYEEKESFSKGYRLMSGDECDEKTAIKDAVKYVKTTRECKKEEIVGIVKEEKTENVFLANKEKKQQQELRQEFQRNHNRFVARKQQQKKLVLEKKSPLHTVFIALISVAIILAVLWVAHRVIKRRRIKSRFVMSSLHDKLDDDDNDDVKNDTFDSKPSSLRRYKDESDVDDETLLPV